MADESNGNGSNIVAIFAIVLLVGMVIAAVMYLLPRMQPQEPSGDGMNIQVELPAPSEEPQEGGEAQP